MEQTKHLLATPQSVGQKETPQSGNGSPENGIAENETSKGDEVFQNLIKISQGPENGIAENETPKGDEVFQNLIKISQGPVEPYLSNSTFWQMKLIISIRFLNKTYSNHYIKETW